MEPKPLHPHQALWIILLAILVGLLACSGYLWQVLYGTSATPVTNNVVEQPATQTSEQLLSNAIPLNASTSTSAKTASEQELTSKAKPIHPGDSNADAPSRQSLLDSAKPLH